MPNSPMVVVGFTRTERSPWRTRSAAAINPLIGREMCVASVSPIHTAASSSSRATIMKIITNVMRNFAALFEPPVLSYRHLGSLDFGENLRIEKAADHQIRVDEPVELDRGAHAIITLGGEQDHLASVCLLDRLQRYEIGLQC